MSFSKLYIARQKSDQTQTTGSTRWDDDIFGCVGVIKSNWFNKEGKLRGYSYGTGWLISPRIVLTCAHNVYSELVHREADQIEFAWNLQKGMVNKNLYKSQKLIIKRERCDKTFNIAPRKEELCLILLDKPVLTLNEQISIKLKQHKSRQFNKQVQPEDRSNKCNSVSEIDLNAVKVVGYPCQSYAKQKDIQNIVVRRSEVEGKLCGVDDFVIYHSAPTLSGHSGSPIVVRNEEGGHDVIGMHTHKSNKSDVNCGLLFNEEMVRKLNEFRDELNEIIRREEEDTIKLYQRNSGKSEESGLTVQDDDVNVNDNDESFENKSDIQASIYRDFLQFEQEAVISDEDSVSDIVSDLKEEGGADCLQKK